MRSGVANPFKAVCKNLREKVFSVVFMSTTFSEVLKYVYFCDAKVYLN
jgi:hypothetical protein